MSMDGATQIPISEFEGRKKAQLKEFVSTVLSGSVNSSTAYLNVVLNKSSQEPPFRKPCANLSPAFAVP